MATKKKLLQAAAGNAGGAGLNVEDVFSTYLNNDGSSDQTIINDIDLAGEGGLVWGKSRNVVDGAFLVDSARGKGSNNNFKYLRSDTASQELDIANRSLSSMNSNGFTFQGADNQFNGSGNEYVYWTFRKAPKFFDVVTYTGNGTAGRTVSHNLGSTPGCIIVKRTDSANAWNVYHRGISADSETDYLVLSSTAAAVDDVEKWNDTAPTSTEFTVGNASTTNASGGTYVAYLFAHNDGDGEFGPDADQDAIKCGSYTGNGSATGPTVNLGFEPQFLLVKNATGGNWVIADTMRSFGLEDMDSLYPNLSNAESTQIAGKGITPTATGFQCIDGNATTNQNAATHIYIAIRRPTAVPTSATEVFDVSVTNYSANQTIAANIDVTDTFMVGRQPTSNNSNGLYLFSRLTGNKRLRTDQAFTENAESGLSGFDTQNGVVAGSSDSNGNVWNSGPFIKYFMKRAPNYFDVVAYTGNGVAGRTVSHNLGVAPEMMWVKCRDTAIGWQVYHAALGNTGGLYVNTTTNPSPVNWWNNTDPSSTSFSLGSSTGNNSGLTFIAYLFATLAGVSKVGSVTHSGTTNVDCGFSSGARFVLLKRTDAASDWYFWDTTRGIVSGNDPYLTLNGTNQPEITNTDYIDPLSSGFTITSSFTSGTYIFYAIA